MDNVTYVFSGKRKQNIQSKNVLAREFYYGATDLDNTKYQLAIIEYSDSDNIFHNLLNWVGRIISKLFSIPFSPSKLLNLKNFKILLKTDHLILINEGAAFSLLPLLIMIKPFHKIKVSAFVMGLYSKKLNYSKFKYVHNFLIKFLAIYLDNIFFLGIGEYNKAQKFHKNTKKLFFFPFCVDTDFWVNNKKYNTSKNRKILFVGNDGNRNTDLLLEISKMLPEYEFTIVSKIPELQNIKLNNVDLLKGSWGDEKIDDKKLRDIYSDALIVVIPLKESSQPSGQSVALQAMSMGVPVLISETEGFWDKEFFQNNVNLFLISPNSAQEWVDKIKYLSNNKNFLNQVSAEAQKVVKNNFNLSVFQEMLKNYL